MELFNRQGKIKKFISDNCIELVEGGLYSLYSGIDEKFKIYDIVKFVYRVNEKDGRKYNNIVDGSMELIQSIPKDITEQYIPVQVKHSPPDRDALIVRQSCLKAAVELAGQFSSAMLSPGEKKKLIISYAEEFEKWVFRQNG